MKKLFSEYELKNIKLKNRICVPPMVVGLTEDGYVTLENVEYYRRLAKGGAGLIIQEATCVNKDGKLSERQLGIWEDGQIEGLKEIVKVVHAQDCKIFIQIHHAGVVGISESPLCPSAYIYQCSDKTVVGQEMTKEDITSIQKDFIEAGRRAYEAGYDGIELHGCHSYLISQFYNKKVNTRNDEYGTNPDRFVLEILDGIRKITPKEFIVGIRLGGFEPTLEDGIKHAKVLEQNGIDFLDISYGFSNEQEMQVSDDYQFSSAMYAAEKIKNEVTVPVFGVHKINSLEIAEEILEKTKIDIVDIGRNFLINPNWLNDAKEGKYAGKCLACPQCVVLSKDKPICPGKVLLERTAK
ncbi:NADH-dependent flavin oxidoreductase [Anaeromicropila herbilytica]|uniref:NADH-dependent flavin oxidoreductase n=1 Tax=Anaeromicropila herbilytica TaxID=2785025 RepID=A0A7R7EMT6_9FIRM|nr:NADH:flavin oxidoreductase [Anaeromicropila herbilytica]BCN31840.1 NADH-dependent flavin oxidoreductase [Anaeromicropila herbilytica]